MRARLYTEDGLRAAVARGYRSGWDEASRLFGYDPVSPGERARGAALAADAAVDAASGEVSPNLRITLLALREYRRNFTRRGVAKIARDRWRALLLRPEDELRQATALSEGAFT